MAEKQKKSALARVLGFFWALIKLILVLAIAAPIVWVNLRPDLQNRYLTLIDPSYGPQGAQASAEGRVLGWQYGVELWQRRPVFGVGPGAFGTAIGSGFAAPPIRPSVGRVGHLRCDWVCCHTVRILGQRVGPPATLEAAAGMQRGVLGPCDLVCHIHGRVVAPDGVGSSQSVSLQLAVVRGLSGGCPALSFQTA